MKYRKRIVDDILDLKLSAFGAVLITGPKGCGKTTTGKQKAKSIIEFQDEEKRSALLETASSFPSKLLEGEKPKLFDEWQDAPKLWGTIRKDVDDTGLKGQYILTGSSSKNIKLSHTGTLRISRMEMGTMSLYESGESSGEISLKDLFKNPNSFEFCKSDLTIDELIFALCRGGWPGSIDPLLSDKTKLYIAKDLFQQIYSVDISNIDNKRRNSNLAKAILTSYSRNLCTLATYKTILNDVNNSSPSSSVLLSEYIDELERLFIIKDVNAWSPQIRGKTAIRTSPKRNLIDPSIAVAALGLSPEYFNTDFKTLGFLFECLCIRDLRVYSYSNGGDVSFYHDKYGLEADAVLHLENGQYALIEFKLGSNEIDKAAKNLNKIESLIEEHNEKTDGTTMRLPDLKLIITATEYGYKREDGVLVIPIGCLRN